MRSLLLASLISIPALANAADLHVGQGQAYATIQAAVDAANDDDTVVVRGGIYAEQVVVDDVSLTSLTIKAYGQDSVTIRPPDTVVNAIIANTVNLRLKNLTIEAPNHLVPAQRAVAFVSETGSLAERFTVGLCNVTLKGDDILGGAGVACMVGQNDTLQVRGEQISFQSLSTNVTTTCVKDPDWDRDDRFCSGW